MDVWLLLFIVYCDVSLDGFGFWLLVGLTSVVAAG